MESQLPSISINFSSNPQLLNSSYPYTLNSFTYRNHQYPYQNNLFDQYYFSIYFCVVNVNEDSEL